VTHSHLLALVVFSALVSSVFAVLLRESLRDRARFALIVFTSFVLSAIVVGWLMRPFPG
jgi:ABC-type sugar transport system permease subunit